MTMNNESRYMSHSSTECSSSTNFSRQLRPPVPQDEDEDEVLMGDSMLDAAIREAQLLEGMLMTSDGLVTPPPTPVLLASPRSATTTAQLESSTTCDQTLDNCDDLDESSLQRLLDVCATDFDLSACPTTDSDDDAEDITASSDRNRLQQTDSGALISPSLDMMWSGTTYQADTPSPSHSDSSTFTRCSTPGVEVSSGQQLATAVLSSTLANQRRQVSSSGATTTITSKPTAVNLSLTKQRSLSPIAANATKRLCTGAKINTGSHKLVSLASANQKVSLVNSTNHRTMSSTNQKGVPLCPTNQKPLQLFSTNHGALTFLPVNRKYVPQRVLPDKPSVLMQKQLNSGNRKQSRSHVSSGEKVRIISIPGTSDLADGRARVKQPGRAKLAHFVLCSPSRRLDKTGLSGVTFKTKRPSQAGTSLSLLTTRRPSLLTLARPSISSSSSPASSSSPSLASSLSCSSPSSSSSSSRVVRNNNVCHLSAADKRNVLPYFPLSPQSKTARTKASCTVNMVNQATQTGDDLEQMLGDTDSTLVRLLLTGQDTSNGYRLCPDGQCITPGSSDSSSAASPVPLHELLGPIQGRGSEMVPSSCIDADDLGCFSELLSPSSIDAPQSVW